MVAPGVDRWPRSVVITTLAFIKRGNAAHRALLLKETGHDFCSLHCIVAYNQIVAFLFGVKNDIKDKVLRLERYLR